MSTNDDEQKAIWNGTAGNAWVDAQPLIDGMFERLPAMLTEVVSPGARVLDIGCGTGTTTIAAARAAGPRGRAEGVDISEPMLAAARARAEREGVAASFVCDNAQTHAFEPASFDVVISRFGVMFFDDFTAAFTNIRRGVRKDGRLRFIAWRSPTENPFMTTAEKAAAPLLPTLPPRKEGPGQFAFADEGKVKRILDASGWSAIKLEQLDVPCTFSEKDLAPYLTRFGPVGRVLHEVDEATRAKIVETVRRAFDPFVHGDEVRFTAACWLVDATCTTS